MIKISDVYEWLNYFDDKKTYLSSSSQVLWRKILGGLEGGDMGKTGQLIADLLSICDHSTHENEVAEVCLNCGIAYFHLRKRKKSIKLLGEAVSRYQMHRHNQTVARWALGYVLLKMTSKRNEAIVQWKNCVETYRHLKESHRFEKEKVVWYQNRILEMDKSLEEAATYTV